MAKVHHKESDFQIRCVKYFRVTYPEFARLMEHPKNEGVGHSAQDRMRQAIAKCEGVQAGVSDLIFHFPSMCHVWHGERQEEPFMVHSLAIELKTKTGSQSPDQKLFQRYFEAAGGQYEVVRGDFDRFCSIVDEYMLNVPATILTAVKDLYDQIEKESLASARKELNRIINKQ